MDVSQLDESWLPYLLGEFDESYMVSLAAFLETEKNMGKEIFPQPAEYFYALNRTLLQDLTVVILGQDPYHGPGQAHGLSFSVPKTIRIPPSLRNIFKEVQSDLCLDKNFEHGQLTSWAEQGVLLLNSVLTVECSQAGSHQNKGWERFTDRVVEVISQEKEFCVFMLWGSYAQNKGKVIDRNKHLVLEAPHPSPLSAYRGFFGCKHFSQCNTYLQEKGLKSIDWSLIN